MRRDISNEAWYLILPYLLKKEKKCTVWCVWGHGVSIGTQFDGKISYVSLCNVTVLCCVLSSPIVRLTYFQSKSCSSKNGELCRPENTWNLILRVFELEKLRSICPILLENRENLLEANDLQWPYPSILHLEMKLNKFYFIKSINDNIPNRV